MDGAFLPATCLLREGSVESKAALKYDSVSRLVAFNISSQKLAKTSTMFQLALKVQPSSQWPCAAEFVRLVGVHASSENLVVLFTYLESRLCF